MKPQKIKRPEKLKCKRILVTGAAGYIGSILTRQLLNKHYFVRGFDLLMFGGESLLGIYNHPNFDFIMGDIRKGRDITEALVDIDAVIHLAAIVGDPACAKQPILAEETNWTASRMLYDLCLSSKGIKRFIFASTCSNYGKMVSNKYVDENSPLKPISLYAELKVKFEEYLLNNDKREDFIPTSLRFATVYGMSPRMRFDLTVNEFVRELTFNHELEVYGEQFWRPYCHVEDLARACVSVLESDSYAVRNNVFNVGATNENYQKKMIVDEISKVVENPKIKYVHRDEDPRDYRVDFSKIKNELGFTITRRVSQGIKEIYLVLKKSIISDPYSEKYRNI